MHPFTSSFLKQISPKWWKRLPGNVFFPKQQKKKSCFISLTPLLFIFHFCLPLIPLSMGVKSQAVQNVNLSLTPLSLLNRPLQEGVALDDWKIADTVSVILSKKNYKMPAVTV